MNKEHRDIWKILFSFVVLFVMYHSAEYMISFKNSIAGFFIFQFLFFLSAWILGNWIKKNGFNFWWLSFSKLKVKHVLIGITLGVMLYGVPYIISLFLGIELLSEIPPWTDILKASIPFSFGVFFSSFSEDILTRGTVFRILNNKIKTGWIILISATVYLLNHIYRLNDGLDTLSYLFLLGVLFIIPLIITKTYGLLVLCIGLEILSFLFLIMLFRLQTT
ncbi:CPBP family glutamic-type intramembrane protease [Yeosuana marina]|uniref:CPBP family glutamic-type intramembrane protease n=1 Tax=Yeosuana marina TaxID=1565536 RepID=UPI001422B2FC|nr:CPBP family glutamic-type intramembrane protease [Yeosuana marina]